MVSSFIYAYFAAFRYDIDGYWCPEGTYTPQEASKPGFAASGRTLCTTFEAEQV